MMRMSWMLALVAGTCSSAIAGAFTFDPSAGLPIHLGDRVVLQEEGLPPLVSDEPLQPVRGEGVLSLLGESARKEFASLDDRLEYTFEFRLATAPGKLVYSLLIPLAEGTKARVTHESYRFTTSTDVVVGRTAERFGSARFVTVEAAGGGFAIDLDPVGVWQDSSDFDKPVRINNVVMTDEGIRLSFERGANEWGGGRIHAKLVLYPEPAAFESIHPFHIASYKTPLEALYFLDFTGRGRNKPPVAVGANAFDTERGYGWVAPSADLTIHDRPGKALVHGGHATSRQPGTFRMLAPKGDYLLTIIVGDPEQPVGPMRVEVNGEPFRDIRVPPAEFRSETSVVTTHDGVIDVQLRGDPWIINGVALHPLMLAHEDYQRRLPWWRHELPLPTGGVERHP